MYILLIYSFILLDWTGEERRHSPTPESPTGKNQDQAS